MPYFGMAEILKNYTWASNKITGSYKKESVYYGYTYFPV